MQSKVCKNCQSTFQITDFDESFLKKMNVPSPTFCPKCRHQRRTAFRNESNLYHNKCSLTGEKIISIYSADKPFKVYKTDIWWSDKWDALDYGQEFDFNKPFFEQFKELQLKVPRPALTIAQNENSPFVNQCWMTKNSYMCFDMGFTEDALYCHNTYHCKNVTDNNFIHDCELCYWLVDCQKCYGCVALQDCGNCSDSYFCFDCKGCSNVAFCSNLRNKNYQIYNKPVPKEEFKKFTDEFKKGSRSTFQKALKEFRENVIGKAIHKLHHNLNTENCTGDYILNSKNTFDSYNCETCQDVRYCNRMDEKIVDCMDMDNCSICELVYEAMCVNANNTKFCTYTYNDTTDSEYCDLTMSCANCFGCIGLQHKKYCILNKQYTKEEYEKLLPLIKDHMKQTAEYGEFFPVSLSAFCYNETLAQEYYPLTEAEASQKGYSWKESDQKEYQAQPYKTPDEIKEVEDAIVNEILACENCGKNFKVISQELTFYKKIGLPIPHNCPVCRHLERYEMRNLQTLNERNCDKCGFEMITTYEPENKVIVYCEKCYLETVV